MEFLRETSDNDDLYSGFDDCPEALSTKDLIYDEDFIEALKIANASQNRIPSTGVTRTSLTSNDGGFRSSLGSNDSFSRRTSTAETYNEGATVRNSIETALRLSNGFKSSFNARFRACSVGYVSCKRKIAPMKFKTDEVPDLSYSNNLKRRVEALVEASCVANSQKKFSEALELAREAVNEEKHVSLLQENAGVKKVSFSTLKYNVLLNLGIQLEANGVDKVALSTYEQIIRSKFNDESHLVRLNVANIYFRAGQYRKALKYYRMTLDKVTSSRRDIYCKILYNIGVVLLKIGSVEDAASNFSLVMREKPDFKVGFNLLLCCFALESSERMKSSFQLLLTTSVFKIELDEHTLHRSERLRTLYRKKEDEAKYCILTGAKLIAPVISSSLSQGYDWCIEEVRKTKFEYLTNEMIMDKVVTHFKINEFQLALETLKEFESKQTDISSSSAANLSLLYFLQGDFEVAEKHGHKAFQKDPYNAGAIVGLGNIAFIKENYTKANELFKVALETDSSCLEALYNSGLCSKKLGCIDESIAMFLKLHSIIQNFPEVTYQIGALYEIKGMSDLAQEYYRQTLQIVKAEPNILSKLGDLADGNGDKQTALEYYTRAYKSNPTNINVSQWLGSYYSEFQMPERAQVYFERNCLLEPDDARWHLMVAGCQRQSGDYVQAINSYKQIHRKFPENTGCLRCLVLLTQHLGLKESQEYQKELEQLTKSKEVKKKMEESKKHYLHKGRNKFSAKEELEFASNKPDSSKKLDKSKVEKLAFLKSLNECDSDSPLVSPRCPLLRLDRGDATRRKPKTAKSENTDEDDISCLLPP